MICTIISLAPPGTKVFVERAFVSNERFSRWLDPSLKDLFIRVFSYDFNNDSMGPCLLCADNISDELRKKFKDLKWKIEEIRAANFPKTA
ncbi:MAG: hypothetical protein Q8R36_04555 [bacterium]|nr:hypothetical protein [bacterium]